MTTPVELLPVELPKRNLPPITVHYAIIADAHPGALPCVLELFALRNITPDLMKVRKYNKSSYHDGTITIDIHVTGLLPKEQDIIRHKLDAQISVQNVREEILHINRRSKLAS
ncbi:hypothetical protein MNBD_ALPHA03-679 [hydrothermal vent metagenome]|uniref:ACT domain-containing protein n=1 Tax=hydrothermal vent metagenome TaxID=652676 RepID=A0A3B1AV17_9ZZZZ